MIRHAYAIAAAVILLLAVLAGLLYGKSEYRQGYQAAEAAHEAAGRQAYAEEVERHQDAATALHNRIKELENAKPKIITQYRERVVAAALPADCRIDDERLRIIQEGLRQAGAAP